LGLASDIIAFLGWKPFMTAAMLGIATYGIAFWKRLAGIERFVLALASFTLLLVVIALVQWLLGKHKTRHEDARSLPEITAQWLLRPEGHSIYVPARFSLMLQNTGTSLAVNLSARAMVTLAIPEAQRLWYINSVESALKDMGTKLTGDRPMTDYMAREWTIAFGVMDKLAAGSPEQELSYRILGTGFPEQDISYILKRIPTDHSGITVVPLIITFSDTSNRFWHVHYTSEYIPHPTPNNQRLTARFIGIYKSNSNDTCLCCDSHADIS
jgi:hypothetical protein